MKKIFLSALLCAMTPFVAAQESSAPVNSVLQLFSCNLNPGQNADDVWSVLEALSKVAQEQTAQSAAPDDDIGIFLWTPFRAATDYDYVWGSTNSSLVAMMDGLATYMGSAAAQSLAPRFQALNESCDTMIAFSDQMKVSSQPLSPSAAGDRNPDGVVETFSCKLRGDSTISDVRSAASYWQEQGKKIASPEFQKYNGYLVTPYRGGTGEADFGWIGTYPDMQSYGRGETAYMDSKEGQAAEARFANVSTCRSALWTGYWVLAPGG